MAKRNVKKLIAAGLAVFMFVSVGAGYSFAGQAEESTSVALTEPASVLVMEEAGSEAEAYDPETSEPVAAEENLTEEQTSEEQTSEEETTEAETSEEETAEAETTEEVTSEEETTEAETSEEETAEEETTEETTSEEETAEETTSEEETTEEAASEEETEEEDLELKTIPDGFQLVEDVWGWYQDGELQTNATGMVKGTIADTLAWYYIKKGIYQPEATGITKKVDTSQDRQWYYVENGRYKPQFTGLSQRASGVGDKWFYVQKGIHRSGKGLVYGTKDGVENWYYVYRGEFQPATGIAMKLDHSKDGKWYYVKDGAFTSMTGFAQRADGSNKIWVYVQNGIYTKSTGMAKGTINGTTSWYYVKTGRYYQASGLTLKIDHSKDKQWYYVKNGRLSLLTGFAQRADQSNKTWYYVQKGKYTRATGIAKGTINGVTGWYYAKNGAWYEQSLIAPMIGSQDNKLYFVSNGRFREVTCLLKRTIDGKTAWWYFRKGALDRSYNGTFTDGIRTYTIVNGQATDCNYYFITDMIELPSGGYNLSTANIGLKVMKVNQRLLGSNSGYYTSATSNAVWNFQAANNLPATGVVDYYTWIALGYTAVDWYNLGTYVTPMKTNELSSREERIQAMLNTAAEYAVAGTRYNDGCSGTPGTYVDCSGLIFQCLYSAGINPDVNIVMHALAQYEYSSTYLAADPWLGLPVSTYALQPGDLVFYGNNGSANVNHVAIYAGNGMIYDSYPNLGVTWRSQYIPGQYMIKAVRVF